MKTAFTDMVYFKGHPSPELSSGIFRHLQDTYVIGQESMVGDSSINTTFNNMDGDAATVVFHKLQRSVIGLLSLEICALRFGLATVFTTLRKF